MPETEKGVLRPLDDDAIGLARTLLRTARYGALATLDPQSGAPQASRTATATDTDGAPVILISRLAPHTTALEADPRCSLLVGEPGKGDPLAHPRITLACVAKRLDRDGEAGRRARRRYLNRHPKAALYADFADFSFFRLDVLSAGLNGGFARAYVLGRDDLLLAADASAAIAEAEQSAVDHMNKDHAGAVALLAGEQAAKGWKLTGVDPEGFDLARGDLVRRVLFTEPLAGPQSIRDTFVGLVKAARACTNPSG
ncbi:MAG: pyridoxamine 5'-phosphate oxidase family protein [Rhizobiaceae bacterium]